FVLCIIDVGHFLFSFFNFFYFFFQAEDGIRDRNVTGVQTCALPIYTTGFWLLRSISATLLSASTSPWRTSVIKMITSAVSMAIWACSLIWDKMISLLSGSIPPVSMRVKE